MDVMHVNGQVIGRERAEQCETGSILEVRFERQQKKPSEERIGTKLLKIRAIQTYNI